MSGPIALERLGGHGGGHKSSKWVKWIGGVVGALIVYATSPTLGALLTAVVVGVLIVLDCVRHPLHILRYAGAMVLFVALLPNVVLGPWMLDMGKAVGSGGDRAAPVVQNWLPARAGGIFNPGPTPTTATPAPVEPAPPAGTPGAVVAPPATTPPTAGAMPAAAPLPPPVPLR